VFVLCQIGRKVCQNGQVNCCFFGYDWFGGRKSEMEIEEVECLHIDTLTGKSFLKKHTNLPVSLATL